MIPEDLMYTKTHEWVRMNGQDAVVGITHFAQESLGDLTFVELPTVGDVLTAGQEMGTVESVKAASEIYAPVAGEVIEVNETLDSNPGLVNEDPYGKGWLIKVAVSEQPKDLLDAAQYAAIVEAAGH